MSVGTKGNNNRQNVVSTQRRRRLVVFAGDDLVFQALRRFLERFDRLARKFTDTRLNIEHMSKIRLVHTRGSEKGVNEPAQQFGEGQRLSPEWPAGKAVEIKSESIHPQSPRWEPM